MIQYVLDWKHYYYLDPTHSRETNIYFAEAILNLKDKWWDFFEFTEYALLMFE